MRFVAVTACPTGIAHSQMAAENVEQTAERLGHEIKVEIQGAMGAENELSAEDVAAADAVIIAADTSVQRDRFEGVPVVKGTVKDGVNDAESLVERAVDAAGGDVSDDETASGAPADDDTGGTADAPEDDSGTGEATDDAGTATADATGTATDPIESDRDDDRDGLFAKLKRIFS